MNIRIAYSKDLEIERLANTQERIGWYKKNGYNVNRFSLPKALPFEKFEVADRAELAKAVDDDFSDASYEPHVATIKNTLPKYADELSRFLSSLGFSPIDTLNVRLTKYGIGGSYYVPNDVVINVSFCYGMGLVRTILHETIHLHIQHLIDRYGVGQWDKEALVDCLFERFMPELLKKQQYREDVSAAQDIFAKNYPNIELIVKLVSEREKGGEK